MSLPSGLLRQIDELTDAQRAALRDYLDHCDASTSSGPNDPEWVAAWMDEIERRELAIEEGREKLLTWEEAKAELDRIVRAARPR